MSWAKLDDGFHNHPKVLALEKDLPALTLWVLGLSYCAQQRTDGVITVTAAARLVGENHVLPWAAALVRVGLWIPERKRRGSDAEATQKRRGSDAEATRWRYHDYDDYNLKDRTIRKRAAAKRARQKRYRENKRRVNDASRDASHDASNDASFFAPVPTRPVPCTTREKKLLVGGKTTRSNQPATSPDFSLSPSNGISHGRLPFVYVEKLRHTHPNLTHADIQAMFRQPEAG